MKAEIHILQLNTNMSPVADRNEVHRKMPSVKGHNTSRYGLWKENVPYHGFQIIPVSL